MNKVMDRVREAWAGGRGGKIESLSETDDPRRYRVLTVSEFQDSAKASLSAHGLDVMKVEKAETRARHWVEVRVSDALWEKIEQKLAPKPSAAPTPPVPDDALAKLQAQYDELQRRFDDQAELLASKSALIDAITSAPERIYIHFAVSGAQTDDKMVTKKRREGYAVVHETFVVDPSGIPIYCAVMERKIQSPPSPHERIIQHSHAVRVIPVPQTSPLNGGSNLLERLLEQDNAELMPILNRLEEAIYGN